MRWWILPILTLVCPLAMLPQSLPQSPGSSMQVVLNNISLSAKAATKNHKELRRYAGTIGYGADWLRQRIREDDPADYRLQLTIDAYLLGWAAQNPDQAAGIMKSVAEDVDFKAKDCLKFGHGRRVPVEIRTMRRGVEDSGWQIRYRWLPPNNLSVQVAELSFPNLSSPSTWDLPVGMYEIYIERVDASGNLQKSAAVVIPVGGASKGSWSLQIP